MLIRDYSTAVQGLDQSKDRPSRQRIEIALYGLAGEIGSLISAVKKRLLAAGRARWSIPTPEILEELGDSLWYTFALGLTMGIGADFVRADVEALVSDVSEAGPRGDTIRESLGGRAQEFLLSAPTFIGRWHMGDATLRDYQRTAFLTSRTPPEDLVEVCLAVLQQLEAELFRIKLPAIEKILNTRLPDRPTIVVLGEVVWHLAALASIYDLSLDDVARANVEKLTRRFGRGAATPLHDEGRPEGERLPRRFSIGFVAVSKGRSRMYLDGVRRLGDDLTDNSYADDGYRFHDVMHLALAAKLGWSPVLRRLMGRKRRSDPLLDEVEDGARAAIVEEALIKVIHSEGVRRAVLAAEGAAGPGRLFADGGDVSFGFLRSLSDLVQGLEVARNVDWEWEDAILAGFEIFHLLRTVGQGTIQVDLERRSLDFGPDVHLHVNGRVAAIGHAAVDPGRPEMPQGEAEASLASLHGTAPVVARRRAILRALELDHSKAAEMEIAGWDGDVVAIRPSTVAREAMWRRGVIAFRVSYEGDRDAGRAVAIGISDD